MLNKHEQMTTEALMDVFQQDGYVRVDPLFGSAEMSRINDALDRFLHEGVSKMPPEQVYREDPADPSSIKQLQKLFDHDPVFRELMFEGPVRKVAEAVLGEPVRPINMQFFNKPPGIGKPTPPHQDGYFFHLDRPSAVTGWLALEDVDDETGCIHYVRGSHKAAGYRPHDLTGVLGFSQGMTDFGTSNDKAETVAMPARAGTLLMHHAKTIHWAGANRSASRSRRALGFIYYADQVRVDEAAKAAYQAKLDRRLRDDGRI